VVEAIAPLIGEPVDRKQLEDGIVAALSAADTRVFLDTSTLIWIYRLHEAARKEFLEWITNGRQRVHIPRRVLHEFSRHRRDPSVLLPFKQQLKSLPGMLKQLDQWAHLIIDDARAKQNGYDSRAKYLSDVANLSLAVERLMKPITSASNLETLDAEVTPVFNNLAIESDIYDHMALMQREYEARAEVRMPPGFIDKKKEKSAEPRLGINEETTAPEFSGANRVGDFLIWQEILEFCKNQQGIADVIILTHDQKVDWSYTPQKIVDNDGHTKPNDKGPFRVTVAHPLLAHEARVKVGIRNLHIITTPQLAWIATQRRLDMSFVELSRAVQVETEATIDAAKSEGAPMQDGPDNQVTERPPEEAALAAEVSVEGDMQPLSASISDFLANLPREALADRLYTRDNSGNPEMDRVIARLKSQNWYIQNPAAGEGLHLLRHAAASALQAFIYGRNIYQAACGSAGTPISIVDNLSAELSSVADFLAVAVYAGALCEAYIGKDGDIRRRPKSEQITGLFMPQDEPRFRPAVEWLRNMLREVQVYFPVLPSPDRHLLGLEIIFDDQNRVSGIVLNGVALTEPYDERSDAEPLPPRGSHEWLREKLARYFALPKNQFELAPRYEGARDIPELQMKAWGVGSQLTFRSD
jgi:predicted nucleic acid-binding protein